MSKQKKARKTIIMSDSLADKIDSFKETNRDCIYEPVKDTRFDFMETLDDIIPDELDNTKKDKEGVIRSVVFISIILLLFLAFCIGGYLFIGSVT